MVSGVDGSCHWLEIFNFLIFKIIVIYGWQHGQLLVTGLIFFSKQLFLQDHRFNQFELFFCKKFLLYTRSTLFLMWSAEWMALSTGLNFLAESFVDTIMVVTGFWKDVLLLRSLLWLMIWSAVVV